MSDEDGLRNKYERLCVEFKKLRTKYHSLKECVSEDHLEIGRLQAKLKEKDSIIQKLENRSTVSDDFGSVLVKTTRNVHENQEANSPAQINCREYANASTQTPNLDPFDQKNYDVHNPTNQMGTNLDNRPLICSNSSFYQAPRSPPTTLINSENNAVVVVDKQDATSLSSTSSLENSSLLIDFTNALREWTEGLSSKEMKYQDDVKSVLVQQIAKLEYQLSEAQLRCQIEKKRRLIEKKNSDPSMMKTPELGLDADDAPTDSSKDIDPRVEDQNLSSFMQQSIHSAIYQAQYFAARASFLQDELEAIVPWIVQLVHKAFCHHQALSEAQLLSQSLQMKLDSTQSNTARQIEEMAKYMADITDELQELRNSKRQSQSANSKH